MFIKLKINFKSNFFLGEVAQSQIQNIKDY